MTRQLCIVTVTNIKPAPNSDRQLVCDSGYHDQQLACPHQCESLSVARLHHRVYGHVHPSHGLHVSSDVCAGEDCGLTGGLVGGTTRQLDSLQNLNHKSQK